MLPISNLRQLATQAAIATIAAAAAAATASFSRMDADPTLFFFDRQIRRRQAGGTSMRGINYGTVIIEQAFRNKTVLVTGSTSGIGKELVMQLAKLGTVQNLILLGGRSAATLEQLADDYHRLSIDHQRLQGQQQDSDTDEQNIVMGPKIWTIPLDMMSSTSSSDSTTNEFELAIDKVEEILREQNCHLDVVVLNAGTGQLHLAKNTPSSETQRIFQVNTLAPIALCQLLLERKLLLNGGDDDEDDTDKNNTKMNTNISINTRRCTHMAVTSSIAALTAVPLSSSYAASKAALHSYFYSIRSEQKMKISLICPGPVDTNFFSSVATSDSLHDHLNDQTVSPGSTAPKPAAGETANFHNRHQHSECNEDEDRRSRSLKMPVSRCVELYISCIVMSMMIEGDMNSIRRSDSATSRVREHWIASQPTLFGLYINRFMPCLFQWLINDYVGPKRIAAWREGKDLYDPRTWRR
jgi:dehydrogenase/reductase SDR family protein 7